MLKIQLQLFGNDSFSSLNDLLKSIKVESITSDSTETFSQLPEGYYFCELELAELTTSKSSGNTMVKWQFKVIEDGVSYGENLEKIRIRKSTGRKIFTYHVLKDTSSLERFISDALKFESEEDTPILGKEYFENSEIMEQALNVLVGSRLWLHIDINEDGNSWTRFISFKRARKLELEN